MYVFITGWNIMKTRTVFLFQSSKFDISASDLSMVWHYLQEEPRENHLGQVPQKNLELHKNKIMTGRVYILRCILNHLKMQKS